MTKRREAEYEAVHDTPENRLLEEVRLQRDQYKNEIDRLRHGLYCIKVEYAYCTQCSASGLAAQVLEQK